MNNNQDKIKFGTKAETLERLRGRLKKSVIDDLIKFTVEEWKKDKNKVLEKIMYKFSDKKVIIRSSTFSEDCHNRSNAGHFTSINSVPTEYQKLTSAINTVIKRYDANPKNQVLIQESISQVDISGVAFSRDINNLSPYITINYDDVSGNTDTITSGRGDSHKTLTIFKGKIPQRLNKKLNRVYQAIIELDRLFDNDALDIEFLYKNDIVHIAQVRPIATSHKIAPSTETIAETLDSIYNHTKEFNLPHPDLYGKKTLYGVMPDWNPAEMIGIKPRPLSLSLYRELITDNVWAFQRDNYGYKRLRSFPLLISIAGHPYIDVRVDFNSFIPKTLDDKLSHKLADFYLNKLQSVPTSHDKVEFEIVYSCYTPDMNERMNELRLHGFSEREINLIKSSLLDLTKNIINPQGLYREDLKKIDVLEERFKKLIVSDLTDIKKIYWLVEDCKRYGTLPFAGIARAGFIAMQFLNSLVNLKIISLKEKGLFLNSLDTVTKRLSLDVKRLARKEISVNEFTKIYGHLRPGSYDIMSESYEENFDKYFDSNAKIEKIKKSTAVNFKFPADKINKIDALMKEHGLNISAEHLFDFIKEATEGREYAKFIFTKNVNHILKLIKNYGHRFSFSKDDMSFVEIGTLMKLYSNIAMIDEEKNIRDEIAQNRIRYESYKYIKLPNLICEPEEIYCFHTNKADPNYITEKSSLGTTAIIKPGIDKKDIKGKIVFIENADPGFDWIFSHKIKGLVTAYGGANSHMAIRAAELGLPAVIGCGPTLFENWSQAKKIEIDCLNKKVTTF